MTEYSPNLVADALWQSARKRQMAHIALPLMVAVVLAVVGAFGSYVSMALPLRLLHFISVGLLIGGMVFVISTALRRFCFAGGLPFWAMLAVAFVTAPPGGWIIRACLALWAPGALRYVSYGEATAQVLALNILIGSIVWILRRNVETPAAVPKAPSLRAVSGHALRARLPVQLRHAAVLALSAEDHYVRVRTDRGDALVLINLSAAISALGESAGVRIHRSHWISCRLVNEISVRGERHGVRIDDNTLLPISRAGRKLLRDILAE